MKAIPLTQARCALVNDEDYDAINAHKWYFLQARGGSQTGYAVRNIIKDGKRTLQVMHRVIMECAPGEEIDHIDGDGLNNMRSNLRKCSRSENQCNRGVFKNNRLGLKGISFNHKRKRFISVLQLNGKKSFRSFETLETAVAARAEATRQLHQQFARP